MTASPNDGGSDLDNLESFTLAVPAGEYVFHEGDSGTDLFIVQEGRIELVSGAAGNRAEATIEAGGTFGELSFFESQPREVSARALTDARLLRLDRATFDRIVAEEPQIGVSMLRALARRVNDQQIALREATVRVTPEVEVAPAGARPVEAPADPADRGDPMFVEASSGRQFPLTDLAEATVGRPDRASGFVPELDLTTFDTDRTLSRRHAKVVRRGDGCFVREEAGTRNGTFVNGRRITTGVEVELRDGDQVQFGFVKMVFQWR